jgi:hypothetical protein
MMMPPHFSASWSPPSRRYPFDKGRAIATALVEKLTPSGAIPMQTYIAVCPDTAPDALFSQNADDQAFSQVVDALSSAPSQFAGDTFWRLSKISYRTKSLIPLKSTAITDLTPKVQSDGDRRQSYLKVVDQSTLYFHLQFHRGREEHGIDYRARQIAVESSPKSSSDLARSSFQARSFGREVVAVAVPATSSLSAQEAKFHLLTKLHDKDEFKDYPYGPQLEIAVSYSKAIFRSLLAIAFLCLSSALFAWAALATSVFATDPKYGYIAPLECRVFGPSSRQELSPRQGGS